MRTDPLGSYCTHCGRVSRTPFTQCCDHQSEIIPDYYALLGCAATATPQELHKHFREGARATHPDLNPDPQAKEHFVALADAYQILRDHRTRQDYDRLCRALATTREREQAALAFRLREETIHSTSRSWAESSFSTLEATLSKMDTLFTGLSDASGRWLKSRPWSSQEHRIRGRMAAVGYGLFGFWFLIAGGIIFPSLVRRQLRRNPEQEETLLTTLGVLQLLPVLGYLTMVDRMPVGFHLLFWLIQAGITTAYLIWRHRFRTMTHPPDKG